MRDIRAILENLFRVFVYKDELISLHDRILQLLRCIQKQDRTIRSFRDGNSLSSSQNTYIRRTFRNFLRLKAAPFYRNGQWIGIRKTEGAMLTERILPIITMFRLSDWRRSTMLLHDIEYKTSATFVQVIRSYLLCKKVNSLQRKVKALLAIGAFKTDLDIVVPYLGSSYRIKWRESDIRFDDAKNLDIATFALPIRRIHPHVAFLYMACTEFCFICGITDDVVHHALTESALNTISISLTT
jgi:hypothetical protein